MNQQKLIVRPESSTELVPFDIVLIFEKGKPHLVYMDEDTKQVVDALVKQHGKLAVKVNWFSPDVRIYNASKGS